MSNEATTDKATTETAPPSCAPSNGSAARVGSDWMQYLEESGNLQSYDGMCDCYRCREIRAGYWPWKEKKTQEAKPQND